MFITKKKLTALIEEAKSEALYQEREEWRRAREMEDVHRRLHELEFKMRELTSSGKKDKKPF